MHLSIINKLLTRNIFVKLKPPTSTMHIIQPFKVCILKNDKSSKDKGQSEICIKDSDKNQRNYIQSLQYTLLYV